MTRQRDWQQKQIASGRCKVCGKKRPKNHASLCRKCADKSNEKRRAQRRRERLALLQAEETQYQRKGA